MIIKHQNKLKEKIISKLLSVIYRLDNSGNSFFNKNGEENFIGQFINKEKLKSPTIFDIGANVGNYSELLVEKLAGKKFSLHIFEPQKSCFSELSKKFGMNNNIHINNFGLSDEEEIRVIYKNEDKSALTSLYKRNLNFYNLKLNVEEEIKLKKVDTYIKQNNIQHIHLLKIDIEGHELKALSGFEEYLNSDFIDYIQFEYGGANLDSHTSLLDFYNLLSPLGFKIAKVMPNFLEVREYNPRFDNFVYANYVAISNRLLK